MENNVQIHVHDHELLYNARRKERPEDQEKSQEMKIGYIRVSRDKQATILQEDAMKREVCERTFTDKMTGKRFDRTELLRMLDMARPGDVIVVWRLDRLGRSMKELIETVH